MAIGIVPQSPSREPAACGGSALYVGRIGGSRGQADTACGPVAERRLPQRQRAIAAVSARRMRGPRPTGVDIGQRAQRVALRRGEAALRPDQDAPSGAAAPASRPASASAIGGAVPRLVAEQQPPAGRPAGRAARRASRRLATSGTSSRPVCSAASAAMALQPLDAGAVGVGALGDDRRSAAPPSSAAFSTMVSRRARLTRATTSPRSGPAPAAASAPRARQAHRALAEHDDRGRATRRRGR